MVYLGDYYKLPQKTIKLIKGSDVIIADGTRLFENIYPNSPVHNEIKKDPDHVPGDEIFPLVKSLDSRRLIFHSITHLPNKLHEELENMMPQRMEVSYDGMTVEL